MTFTKQNAAEPRIQPVGDKRQSVSKRRDGQDVFRIDAATTISGKESDIVSRYATPATTFIPSISTGTASNLPSWLELPIAGVMKDVVMVGGYQEAEIDFTADNPGLTLFHCHQQLHMDFGFMTLFDYV